MVSTMGGSLKGFNADRAIDLWWGVKHADLPRKSVSRMTSSVPMEPRRPTLNQRVNRHSCWRSWDNWTEAQSDTA